ncbi:MAG: molybdopterin-dependent oxidoreductase [Rhodobacter sp.]|nr:molybdopterin-dependent oxidoreductase [Rhodobacter sp.]
MKHISQPHPMLDAGEKVSGRLVYLDDMQIDGLLHARLVWSPLPHARILRIDTEAARRVPGVVEIFHHGNSPANTYNSTIWYEDQEEPEDERMFPEILRHVGDRVAAVVAETPQAARAAAALIVVEYEPLPAFLTTAAALADDDRLLKDGGAHLAEDKGFAFGQTDAAFAEADLVVTSTVSTPRTHHCAIENHTCVAMPESDGRILILSPCQSIFSVQMVTARALAFPLRKSGWSRPPSAGRSAARPSRSSTRFARISPGCCSARSASPWIGPRPLPPPARGPAPLARSAPRYAVTAASWPAIPKCGSTSAPIRPAAASCPARCRSG